MSSRSFVIKSLTLSEMLDEAFHVLREGLGPLIFFQLIISVPGGLAFAFLLHRSGEAALAMVKADDFSFAAVAAAALPLLLAAVLTTVVLTPIASVAFARAVSAIYLGRPFGVGSLLRDAVRLGPGAVLIEFLLLGLVAAMFIGVLVLGTGLVTVFRLGLNPAGDLAVILSIIGVGMLGFGAVLCVSVYFILRFGLSLTAYAIEEIGIGAAFRRSQTLMKGRYLPALAVFTVVFAVSMIGGVIISVFVPTPSLTSFDRATLLAVLPQFIRAQTISSSLGSIVGAVVGLYGNIVWTLFYFTARCDREGFDLTVLAERLPTEA